MKTQEETRAVAEGLTHLKPSFDGTDRDEALIGVLQAVQDFCLENEALDRYELAGHHSEHFAKGYAAGMSLAWARFSALQSRRGFPGDKGFVATAVYGRAR